MRPLPLAAALLALILGAAPVLAGHPNDHPTTALPFVGAAEGDVEAAPPILRAGRFAFYTVDLPGDGAELTVEVEITPGDPVSASRAGVKVYGPTGGRLYAEGAQTATHPSHRATFAAAEPGRYTLQVFNFNVTPIHYRLRVLGLPPLADAPPAPTAMAEPAPPAPPPPTPTPLLAADNRAPERAAELTGPAEGRLPGDQGGSFHYYRLAYPGDGSPLELALDLAPPDAGGGPVAGLIVYGPTAGREYLRLGYQAGGWPRTGGFRSDEAGVYVVQVGNYGDRPLSYRLTASGPDP